MSDSWRVPGGVVGSDRLFEEYLAVLRDEAAAKAEEHALMMQRLDLEDRIAELKMKRQKVEREIKQLATEER